MHTFTRWIAAITGGFALLVVTAGAAGAVTLKLRWHFVADASQVLVGPRYLFVDGPPAADGSIPLGGSVIDEQTGKRTRVVPPVPSGYSCAGQAAALGGPWVAFLCWVPSPLGQPPVYQVELYRIATRYWRALQPSFSQGSLQAIGADWMEYWLPNPNANRQQFVFQNIYTGQSRMLAGWQPGGRTVPDLNSPLLGRRLCAPVRVPNAWEGNGEDWPGTVSSFGRYAVVEGTDQAERPFGYLERCGTRMHRWIGPLEPLGDGYASANAQAAVWQWPLGADLHGAFLPSLKKFTVDTTDLVNSVASPYTGQNSYLSWLTPRTLYVLVQPYYPTDCTPTPCPAPPSRLYAAPAPRPPRAHPR